MDGERTIDTRLDSQSDRRWGAAFALVLTILTLLLSAYDSSAMPQAYSETEARPLATSVPD